jgi:molybdopterin molybdotransferase
MGQLSAIARADNALLDLDTALSMAVSLCAVLPAETLPIAQVAGRTLASDCVARLAMPAADIAAMDGYAVRYRDCQVGGRLTVTGTVFAGDAPRGVPLGAAGAIAVATGALLPPGADHVVPIEHVLRVGDDIHVTTPQPRARHIRFAGEEWRAGTCLLQAGSVMTPHRIARVAAAGLGEVAITQQPRVLVITIGDELQLPGEELDSGQIFDSNALAIPALLSAAGAVVRHVGPLHDHASDVMDQLNNADANLIVLIGGASVGERDIAQDALIRAGGSLAFAGVSIRPGRPVWAGRTATGTPVLGLPGTPAAASLCARIFGVAMLRKLLGQPDAEVLALVPCKTKHSVPCRVGFATFVHASMHVDHNAMLVAEVSPSTDDDASVQHAQHDGYFVTHYPAGSVSPVSGFLSDAY